MPEFLCFYFLHFFLISAQAFCACRVCVKCAQTQISRLKNFIFQSFLLLHMILDESSVPCKVMNTFPGVLQCDPILRMNLRQVQHY